MIIVARLIDIDTPASEKRLQVMKHMNAPLSLNHRKARLTLPADSVCSIPKDRNAEASFAVDEADSPLLESWPFLLIFRTGRIVTDHASTLIGGYDIFGTAGFSDVPAFSQLQFTTSPL